MKKPYCVIHPMVDAQRVQRTWLKTVDEGVAHATKLIEQSKYRGKLTRKLFVVRVMVVVEPEPQVKVIAREPKDDDLIILGYNPDEEDDDEYEDTD